MTTEEKNKDIKKERNTQLTQFGVYMLDSEKKLLDNMIPILHKRGYISSINRSEAVRYCVRAIGYLLFKEIEEERYGRKEGET